MVETEISVQIEAVPEMAPIIDQVDKLVEPLLNHEPVDPLTHGPYPAGIHAYEPYPPIPGYVPKGDMCAGADVKQRINAISDTDKKDMAKLAASLLVLMLAMKKK